MNRNAQLELLALYDERLMRKARHSLRAFVEVFWPRIEPGSPFQCPWHLENLIEHLEAVTAGEIPRLVINLPPRHGKSLLVSVFWPVWAWLAAPEDRWLFLSGSERLVIQHSLARRHLLRDERILSRFPYLQLVSDRRAKEEFQNTRRGVMLASSMGGSVLGKGGKWLVLDDPQTVRQVRSEMLREKTNRLFREELTTRADDKKRSGIVVVQQRLHVEDLSAMCKQHDFTCLSIPAVESSPRPYVFPLSGRIVERPANEPLWPEREDAETLAGQQQLMGTSAFNAQYLQRPDDPRGSLFDPSWWAYYDDLPIGGDLQWLQSWDLAFKDGPNSDYVVGLVAVRKGALVYIVDRFKERRNYPETKQAMLAMLTKYRQTTAVLVEEAANGSAVVQELRTFVPE